MRKHPRAPHPADSPLATPRPPYSKKGAPRRSPNRSPGWFFGQGRGPGCGPQFWPENTSGAGAGGKQCTPGSGDNHPPQAAQPADTHHSHKDKTHPKKRSTESTARSPTGAPDSRDAPMATNNAVRHVCQTQGPSKAPDHNGFGRHQRLVRRTTAEEAGFPTPVSVPTTLPNLAQFRSIWPSDLDVAVTGVFSPIRQPA